MRFKKFYKIENRLLRQSSKMADCFTDEPGPLEKPSAIRLGILGHRNDCTQQRLVEEVLTPLLQELGRPPEQVLLPSEGTSSIYISDWADQLSIPTQTYEADWRRHQRRALVFRDARIQQEATHFVIFLNKRSEANAKLAMRLARKGHSVLTVSYASWELEYLTSQETPLQEPSWAGLEPEEPDRTRDTGTAQELLQSRQSGVPGSQSRLTDLWGACRQTECQ
jgi:hypothetical protein